ncbi:hypothetical protein [Clostridium sp. CF012]|uniref:hypothetical protein n=1 Tax=Clostridium sp. CF012 TaxID=2843319 RepID=UPI001C0CB934|nr:hypothetical protein [Clostridium sp. CF012]MBU3142286.1 hypothetical protein [Clostridium sp. CF012]
MGIGYVFGCLFSILLWKLDRQGLFYFINIKLRKKIKNIYAVQFLYFLVVIAIYIGLSFVKSNEVYNALTAFIVIDVSNTERKNLNHTERKHFYDTMSTISRSLVCGFIAPLFYIIVFGNEAAIVFTLIFNLSFDDSLNIIGVILSIACIIPALIAEIFLYAIYVFKNKNLKIKFKGDYINNLWKTPLVNVDILAAYIESVNFYFYYNGNNMHYLKSYGEYNNKIDDACIKDYLSVSYTICFILFIAILLIQLL